MKKFLTTVFAAAAFATPLAGAMYENEFPFIIREPAADSVVNVSFLNHKPAGKHGVLRAVGGGEKLIDWSRTASSTCTRRKRRKPSPGRWPR